LRYADARHATIIASGIMPKSFSFRSGVRALFERGAYELETLLDGMPPKTSFRFCPEDGPPGPVPIAGHNPYAWELSYFVDCVSGRADRDLFDPRHALAALQLSLATQRSLRDGQPVDLT
jgi:predicted dehydrogenase